TSCCRPAPPGSRCGARASCAAAASPTASPPRRARPAPRRPRTRPGRRPPPRRRSARDRLRRGRRRGRGLRDRHLVSALQALAHGSLGLGLLLLHPDEPAARAGDRHGPVPDRVVALGIAQASEEGPALAGAALGEVADPALRTLHAEPHRPREPALRIALAGDERAEAPAPHRERAAARRALLFVQLRKIVHLADQL